MTKRDYYEILGVSKSAAADELKKAYRQMAIKHHPDKNPGDKGAEEKFKEAAEAYDVLSNADKKARYDQFGHAGMSGAAGGGGYSSGGFSMDDIFSQFGDIFGGGGFGGFSGFGGGGGGQRANRGSDVRIRIKMNLKEVALGVEKKVRINKKVTCSTCRGTGAKDASSYSTCKVCNGAGRVTRIANTILGQMQTQSACTACNGEGKTITNPCLTCKGEGVMQREEEITFKIPAGVSEGMQLNLSQKGNAARRGGVNGDLLVVIEEEKNDELQRDENDLIYSLFITISQAALGDSVEVPTVDGKVKIKIEAGTQPGRMLRLRGKGLPDVNGYHIGDLLVNVNVWIPKNLSKDEKKMLETLSSSTNFKPDPTKDERNFFERMRNMFR